MAAVIYRPAKTAMQSGRGRTRDWIFEYEPETNRDIDPLMGWTGSADMNSQIRLRFADRDSAIAYAERHHIPYRIVEPKPLKHRPKAYADNFKYGRLDPWTH